MMSKHSIQVCLNGCVIDPYFFSSLGYSSPNRKFCEDCGGRIFTNCLNCGTPISVYRSVFAQTLKVPPLPPNCCRNCGEAFPWKGKKEAKRLETEEARESKNEIKNLETESEEPIVVLKDVFSKFHLIAQKLLNRHADRETLKITDEYDVQDLLSALLTVYFDDVRPEEPTPSHAAKSAKMDFLLKKEGIAIEVKMIREGLTDKKVADELIIDIARYKKHSDSNTLICFIYDPKVRITNPQALIGDLQSESTDDLEVVVFVNP